MPADSKKKPSQNEEVSIFLELGHSATPREKPTAQGYTHDWTVFVRGLEGIKLEDVVERVIFFLHQDFPKPRRICKTQPFQVSETGYAGFELPIDVYFKNDDPKQFITFHYDIVLDMLNPVKNVRRERVTFLNPSQEFKRRLAKAGCQQLTTLSSSVAKSPATSSEPGGPGHGGESSSRPQSASSSHSAHSSRTKHDHQSKSSTASSHINSSKVSNKHAGTKEPSGLKHGGSNGHNYGHSLLDKSSHTFSSSLPAPPPLHPANSSHKTPPTIPKQEQQHPTNSQFDEMFGPPIQANIRSNTPDTASDSKLKNSQNTSKANGSNVSSKLGRNSPADLKSSSKTTDSPHRSQDKNRPSSSLSKGELKKSTPVLAKNIEMLTKAAVHQGGKESKKRPHDKSTDTSKKHNSGRDSSLSSNKSDLSTHQKSSHKERYEYDPDYQTSKNKKKKKHADKGPISPSSPFNRNSSRSSSPVSSRASTPHPPPPGLQVTSPSIQHSVSAALPSDLSSSSSDSDSANEAEYTPSSKKKPKSFNGPKKTSEHLKPPSRHSSPKISKHSIDVKHSKSLASKDNPTSEQPIKSSKDKNKMKDKDKERHDKAKEIKSKEMPVNISSHSTTSESMKTTASKNKPTENINNNNGKHSRNGHSSRSPVTNNEQKFVPPALPSSSSIRSPPSVDSVASVSSKSPPDLRPTPPGIEKASWYGKMNINELYDLQARINSMTDRRLAQRVVDIIDNAHADFSMDDEWLEFDFNKLDLITLNKIKKAVFGQDNNSHSNANAKNNSSQSAKRAHLKNGLP